MSPNCAAVLTPLPARSTWVAVRLCNPLDNATVGVKDQAPVMSATALPSLVAPSEMVTVAPISALPVMVGVLLLVSAGPLIDGGFFFFSIHMSSPPEATPTFPARSVACAAMVCLPSASGAVGVILQAPVALAVAVPSTIAPSYSVTVAPFSAVPVKAGAVLRVMLSVFEAPVSLVAAISGADGAPGPVMSRVTLRAVEAALVLPARSVALAVMLCVPSVSAAAMVQTPLVASAVAAPGMFAPSYQRDPAALLGGAVKAGLATLVM